MTKDYPPEWHAAAAIGDLLQPDERLLWQGSPGLHRTPVPTSTRPAVLGGMVLGTALLAWAFVDRDAHGSPNLLSLVAALAAWTIAGLLVAFAKIPVLPLQQHHAYAVTDRRVLFVAHRRRRIQTEAYGPAQITQVVTKDHGDGSADVVFREGPHLRTAAGFGWLPSPDGNPIGFFGIRDAATAAAALTWLRSQRPVAAASPAWDASPSTRPDRETPP